MVDQIKQNNDRVLQNMRGIPAQPSTPESESDPRNPNTTASQDMQATRSYAGSADLLGVMAHGHADPIADEHYAWAVAEIAALRGKLSAIRETLAGSDISNLPNDYPTERMAADRMRDIAQPKRDREPFIGVIASLAAAISLLERIPNAKKAAPSAMMFEQMLTDYRKALEVGRSALSSTDREASK